MQPRILRANFGKQPIHRHSRKMNDSPSGDDTTLHDSSGHASKLLPSMAGREQQHLPVPENLGNIFGSIP